MNKDQVKGTTKDIAEKIQEEAGRATGSKEHEARPGANDFRQSAEGIWRSKEAVKGGRQALSHFSKHSPLSQTASALR